MKKEEIVIGDKVKLKPINKWSMIVNYIIEEVILENDLVGKIVKRSEFEKKLLIDFYTGNEMLFAHLSRGDRNISKTYSVYLSELERVSSKVKRL